MASTKWPRWRLPFAYGSAIVTSVRMAAGLSQRRRSGAHLREQPLDEKPLVGAALQGRVRLGAQHQRPPPVRARPPPRPAIAQVRDVRVGDLLALARQLRLDLGKDVALEFV